MTKWAVCVALLAATMLNYMDRQALAVSLPVLKRDHALLEDRVGTLEMAFGLAFAAGSLLFGYLADRLGPRLLYPLVLAGWSAAGAASALAAGRADDDLYTWFLVCRTLLGFLEAGHWPCALLTLRAVLDDRERTLGNGLLQAGASLGAIVVPRYVSLVEAMGYGWPATFASIGVIGLLWLPLWFALTRNLDLSPRPPARRDDGTTREPLLGRLLALAVVVGCLNVSWQFLRAWLPLYLEDNQKLSTDATRWAVSGYFLASDVGCVLAGVLVRQLIGGGWSPSSARAVGFTLFAGLTLAAAAVPWVPGVGMKVALLMVAGAGILGLHPLYYAAVQELPRHRVGVLAGGLAAFGWVIASGFQFTTGRHIKGTQSYADGLTVAGGLPVVAVVAVWWMRSSSPLPLGERGRG